MARRGVGMAVQLGEEHRFPEVGVVRGVMQRMSDRQDQEGDGPREADDGRRLALNPLCPRAHSPMSTAEVAVRIARTPLGRRRCGLGGAVGHQEVAELVRAPVGISKAHGQGAAGLGGIGVRR